MRLAGSVARIVMADWGTRMMTMLKENNIKVDLAACYVDDVRFVTSYIEKGVRWESKQKRFMKKDEWLEEDKAENVSDEQRTARELKKAMNSIFPNIQFTTEIPEDFHDGRLPTLDCTIWLENGRIMYSFYEKEMNSPFCILEQSALPDNTKISSLSQDVVRRMLNTSELVPQEERNNIVEKFISKLRRSGYRKDQVKEIIKAGLKGYERKLEKAKKEGKSVHRDAKSTSKLRFKKKLTAKTNWFKKDKKNEMTEKVAKKKTNNRVFKKTEMTAAWANTSPVAVLFVAKTPGGELAKRLRLEENEIERMTGDRIKIVERAGVMVKRILHKSNPWAGGNCGRGACLICRQEKGGGDCKKRNITYKTQCLLCHENGKVRQYFGESSRTGFERGQEHENDFLKHKEESHMFKHWLEEHPGNEKPTFSMKVLRGHSSSFVRQIHEAVLIEMNVENVLNSKGEYNRCQLPRLGVKMGVKDVQENDTPSEMTENDIFSCLKGETNKRKDEEHESWPQNKRRKFRVGKPTKTPTSKRPTYENGDGRPGKKARMEMSSQSGDEQKNRHIPTIVVTPAYEDNQTALNTTTTTTPAQLRNLPVCEIEGSRITKCDYNVHDQPTNCSSLAKKSSSPNLSKSLKPYSSPNSVKQIISFFEDCTVYKQGGETSNSIAKIKTDASPTLMKKTENNAYPPPSITTQNAKSELKTNLQLKSKQKKSKLCPPALFKFKKISDHFSTPKPPIRDQEGDHTDQP